MPHRAVNATSYAGSVTTIAGGLVAQASSPQVQGVGIGMGICGLVGLFLPLFFKDRADKRAHDAQLADLRRENEAMRRRLDGLDAKSVQVDANTAHLAATRAMADAAVRTLQVMGYLRDAPAGEVPARVLVVEDNQTAARALLKVLAREGFEVDYASDCAAALDRLDSRLPFDWLVLDLMIAGCEGEDILREVRARRLSTRVVVTTGVADAARLDRLAGLRPDRVLIKPIDLPDLLGQLRTPRPTAPVPVREVDGGRPA